MLKISFSRNKENYETRVAQAKDIVRNLNATHINNCSGCHLGVSYVKTTLNFNRSSQW